MLIFTYFYHTLYWSLICITKCQLVFVCQFKIDMFFAPSHDDTEQFVKFHHYTLGPHESMARLGYMFFSPLHTCVHCISRITDPSSCLHTCTVWRHEMYIGIDSHLIDLSLCCIICSQIKTFRILYVKPEVQISCHSTER